MTNLFHVTKDPVHGTMQFNSAENNWIKPFIDSPNFQRLRHIKQLGMGDFIFPGAVHSRFNHSFGCCYVASQIAQKIGLADEERQLVMIACLLHDIGHGPFSHAFEDLFQNKMIRHEDWTPYFLHDYKSSEFFAAYNQINPANQLTEDKFNHVTDMIMHNNSEKTVLADIVSSQLDADRLDYLLRDSHFCGVRYGEFDFRWMLHCMAIVNTDKGKRLGITHKGIGVVEHYLMARRLMMRNIYKLQKKLAFENFMVELLILLSASLENHPPFQDIQLTGLGKFLIAANQFNKETNKQTKEEFLKTNYKNYKELCDYDVFALIKRLALADDSHPACALAKRLHHRHMPKIYRLDRSAVNKAKTTLTEFLQSNTDVEHWQLAVIETPHQSYTKEDPILVRNEKGVVQPISDFSYMINAITDHTEHLAFVSIDQAIANDARIIDFLQAL